MIESKKNLKVVIPCRNEVNNIEECVNSVIQACQNTDLNANIYIVDGKSDDGTLAVIAKLSEKYPNVHLVVNEHQLTPYAFNLGIKTESPFDYLAIVGSRHVLSSNYFSEAVAALSQNPEIWCVGGRVDNVYSDEQGKITAQAMGTSFGMGLGNFRAVEKSGFVDTVGTPVYPAWVFEKIGYFDNDLTRNQDDEFNFRVTKAGGKIFYIHHISVQYYVRANRKQLKKQFAQYGYWKVFVNRKHKSVTTLRQLIPPLFVLYLMLLPFPFLFSWVAGLIGAVPLVLYFIMSFLVSVKQATSVNEFFQFFRIFPVIHISYGMGYLKGIMHFMILNRKPSQKANQLTR
jgi:GT2 family glycosyltransferase